MFIKDLLNELSYFQLNPGGVTTSTVTGTGVDIQNYTGEIAISLDCPAATAGTNPTMTVKIQDSADNSTWADCINPNTGTVYTFAQVTGTSANYFQQISVDTRVARRYIRTVGTIGGTASPSFPSVGVTGIGSLQYTNFTA